METFSDDKLFFDVDWYREQIIKQSKGENHMSDPTDEKEDKGSGDTESEIAGKDFSPCHCCEGTECRLPTNKWTDE